MHLQVGHFLVLFSHCSYHHNTLFSLLSDLSLPRYSPAPTQVPNQPTSPPRRQDLHVQFQVNPVPGRRPPSDPLLWSFNMYRSLPMNIDIDASSACLQQCAGF
ncbi:hypothetical protein M758_3G139700 [Ceratodon purpureus]|nr:hypothetical protein M758_3G139700 [Ceratodon purpureus]